MDNPLTFEVAAGRTNIYFDVVHKELMSSAHLNLYNFLEDKLRHGGSGIVYVRKKSVARALCMELNQRGMQSLEYHKGLTADERQKNQDSWMQNEVRVMVATISFGLGIDKRDVRAVAHWGFPDDMESCFQEAGRAGRDGNPSWSRLYSSSENRAWKEGLIAREPVGREKKQANFRKLTEAMQRTDICRHAAWDEALDSIEKRTSCNGMCDVCFDPKGVAGRAIQLQQIHSFPMVNQVADNIDDLESSDTDECLMCQEVLEKFSCEDEYVYESTSTEEDQLERRLGRKHEDVGSVDEEENLAEYFHTCGNCNEENVNHMVTHLNNNNACLEAYSQSILKQEVINSKQQTLLDLALLMGACLHPDCENPHYGRSNLKYHVKNGCKNYYHYFTQTNLGAAWQDANKLNDKLLNKLRAMQGKTSFKGSSNEASTLKRLPMRNPETERKSRWREEIKRKNTTDPRLAMNFFNLEQADVLSISCYKCRHQFSRPHTQQSSSAIKPLKLDNWDEVAPHLRSVLQGCTPEDHLLSDGEYWICSGCEKPHPPSTRFDGNLPIYQVLQDEKMFTLKAVKIFDINNKNPVLIMAPSKFPTLDIDGKAATLSSDFSLSNTFVMLAAGMSGVDAFAEDFPAVLTRDWSTLAKFMAAQSILPGIYTLPNILVNYHRAQIQKAKVLREEQNKQRILAKSRTDETGTLVLDKLDLTQNTQSNDNVGEPD